MEFGATLVILAAAILACLLSSKISTWLNMPTLLFFLGVGMLFGSEGIGRLSFDNADLANRIGSVAMAFILFSGGFDTRWKSVRPVLLSSGILASLGVFLTALFVGLFCYYAMRLLVPGITVSFAWCFLLGSIISSTDAAAVFAILRSHRVSLRGQLQPLLEFESGSNDPMAAFLTIFMVQTVLAESSGAGALPSWHYLSIIPWFFIKMSLGIIGGLAFGRAAVWLYNQIDFEYDGLYYVLAFVSVVLTYAGIELIGGNGFMAVYVCGMVMGNGKFIYHNGIGKFSDGFAWLMQVVLFGMLGLLSSPRQIWEVKWIGLAVAAFLMLLARPATIFICLLGSKFKLAERTLISWVGLRGGAPIMLATFPLMNRISNDSLMFHIVFFIVISSVAIQGMSIMTLARFLHLDLPLRKTPRVPLSFENTGTMDASSRQFVCDERADRKTLAELGLPPGALVMLIRREGSFLIPQGNTILQKGDCLMIMGADKALEQSALLLQEKEG
ncbi:MAG: potassium/proton antiporter [Lentisphaeria bacterium]|jgi:cell volume regulation protein A|nr:potassium/proton antiporter [Lentisphaeria bacterium]MDY0175367.1 potassium/proton antiporter [Lentisphaeria bacterium]NLZ59066.1 potassium/proton antiporter [Lentisphaerota bacterium]